MQITYIIGGILILVSISIFIYNWRHPTDDMIPTMPEAIRNSNVVWGMWHTGERVKRFFKYKTVNRVLLLEPNDQNISFTHMVERANVTRSDLLENIHLTTEDALEKKIDVRWYDDQTVLSFMICDSSAIIKNNIVEFSKKAYVVVQVVDGNLDRDEWSFYKKTMAKDKYAFNAYVKWFKDVWDNKSKEAIVRVS